MIDRKKEENVTEYSKKRLKKAAIIITGVIAISALLITIITFINTGFNVEYLWRKLSVTSIFLFSALGVVFIAKDKTKAGIIIIIITLELVIVIDLFLEGLLHENMFNLTTSIVITLMGSVILFILSGIFVHRILIFVISFITNIALLIVILNNDLLPVCESIMFIILPLVVITIVIIVMKSIQERFFDMALQESDISKRALQKEQEYSELKSQFVANVSHELRTPLSIIIGYTQLMSKKSHSEEKQKTILKKIDVASNTLLRLVNDILDLSMIERKRQAVRKNNINIDTFIEDIEMLFDEKIRSKGIDFIIEKNDGMIIFTDEQKLRQILINLINNAIKFTENGKVILRIEDITQNNRHCTGFSVIDTGIGIPKDKLKKIFKPFIQVDGSLTRKYGGTGLGLAIVNELISLLGSKINVESEENKGSTFSFVIPAK